MKQYTLLGILLVIISCNKIVTKTEQPSIENTSISKGFKLHGSLKPFFTNKVYLNKIIENSIYQIDSAEVINNDFTFKGTVEFPERFGLTFENYSSTTIIVIENTQFDVVLNSSSLNDPIITGSKLNNKLYEYKNQSKNIFKKIDYLFPIFQKARLENDVQKLNEIQMEMKKIENEFTEFSFNFIIQNKESYIAAMILRDQLKSTTIDTLKIKETYQKLSSDIKNSPDSEIIASFLNLH